MHSDSMNWWACPRDGHYPLVLSTSDGAADEVREGGLLCPRCGNTYAIRDGIPDFLLFEDEESAQLKQDELDSRERELDWPTEMREVYESRLEADSVLARLQPSAQDRVLDAGCGLGRITRRVLDSGATVVAADFSRARLKVLRAHTAPADRVELAVADANHLPLRPNSFTKILCTQVLEHLPTPELRRAFIGELFELLVPGGELVLTVYNFDQAKRRRGLPREGKHESGIFYHCYEPRELRADLQGFEVREVCGIRHYLRGSYKLKIFPRLGRLGHAIDRALEGIPALSLRYGSLLLAHAVKPIRRSVS